MSKEDAAVNEEVVAESTITESAPVENNESVEVDDSFVKGLSDDDESISETEVEVEESEEQQEVVEESGEAEADETETAQDDTEEEKPLAPKSVNRFQKLANENRELKERLSQIDAKQAQVATEQELLGQVNPETGDYYTVTEAEREARLATNEQIQQVMAQEKYQLEVQQNREQIINEGYKALDEFPELDETNDKFDRELAVEYDAALRQALILDQQGNPIGAYMSPYQLAKSIAGPARRAAERAKTLGQAEAQKAQAKMSASADVPSRASGAVNKPKDDPFLSGFNSVEY